MEVYLRVREGLRDDRPWSIPEMSFILGLDYIHISEVRNEDKMAGHYKKVHTRNRDYIRARAFKICVDSYLDVSKL